MLQVDTLSHRLHLDSTEEVRHAGLPSSRLSQSRAHTVHAGRQQTLTQLRRYRFVTSS